MVLSNRVTQPVSSWCQRKFDKGEKIIITYENMIETFALTTILGRCVMYLEEKRLSDFT